MSRDFSVDTLFDVEGFTLHPRRDYDPEKWTQEVRSKNGYDETVFHGRTVRKAKNESPVGMYDSRHHFSGETDPLFGWHVGSADAAMARTSAWGDSRSLIPLKQDTAAMLQPSDHQMPYVGTGGGLAVSDMWANDADESHGAGGLHDDEWGVDLDHVRNAHEARVGRTVGDDELYRILDSMTDTDIAREYGEEALAVTRASDLMAEGKTIPYVNSAEHVGSTSYRAPRQNLKTWREDVLSDPQAPPRWRHIAEAGMDLHFGVGEKVTLPFNQTVDGKTVEGAEEVVPDQGRFFDANMKPWNSEALPYPHTTGEVATPYPNVYDLRYNNVLGSPQFSRDRRAPSNVEWGKVPPKIGQRGIPGKVGNPVPAGQKPNMPTI